MPTITPAEREARYDAISALMKELLRAIRRSITTEVKLDNAGHFARSDTLQSERHKMEKQYRALRKIRATRSDVTKTIRAATGTLNTATNNLTDELNDLATLSKSLQAAATILGIVKATLLLI